MGQIREGIFTRAALEPRQMRDLLVLDERGAALAQSRVLEERVLAHARFRAVAATANWKTRFAARIVVCVRWSVIGLTSLRTNPSVSGASATSMSIRSPLVRPPGSCHPTP